ncbi:hypothetical protein ABLE93_13070 [Xanthobacter sp. KR7-65]|uniref:hypothetical protein n=1 Tax=Xanthobacter sp. KR7-65 TaxID=3156612 RepID=UPI0032B48AF5
MSRSSPLRRPSRRPVHASFHQAAALALALAVSAMAAAPVLAGPALAATKAAPPDAATLLFETPQLAATKPGETLAYAYTRKVSDPELGATFDDRIVLHVEASAGGGDARDVKVDFFSAERHRAAGPFEDVTTNPVLLLFLENHLADLAGRLKGNPRYFKNAIRSALRDAATVEPAELSVGGKTLSGWRVSVSPFKGDTNASRMRGLDSLVYSFDITPDLPGEIARIAISAEAPGGRLWEESIAYDPKGI